MRLLMDTSKVRFTVSRATEPKRDDKGNQRMDRKSGAPLYSVELIARHDEGADILSVTVAGTPPKVAEDQSVSVVGLTAVPWVRGNGSNVQIAFRADSIVSVSGAKGA
jgi:hypothetical protein